MNGATRLTLITAAAAGLWIALPAGNPGAQDAADIEGVKAASKAFYTAFGGSRRGTAMGKVWLIRPTSHSGGPAPSRSLSAGMPLAGPGNRVINSS